MKRAHYIVLAAVLVLTVALIKLPARTATQFKLAIGSVFLPLFGLAGSGQQLTERAGNAIIPRGDLLKQNEQLHRENAEMKVQLQRLAEFERENERLRVQIGFKNSVPKWKIKPARVIARDPANWWRNVQIDLGKRDGLKPDLAVLTSDGLVGRVSEVSETRSRVLLLGDPNCRVPALVYEPQTRATIDHGVITVGASVLDENMVELGFLSRATTVKPGQLVVTSDHSAIFQNGILIGQVVDTRPVDFGLYTVARVKLAVKMNLLDEVWVMMP